MAKKKGGKKKGKKGKAEEEGTSIK